MFDEIAEVIGTEKTKDLCRAFGGQTLYISKKGRYAGELSRVLGDAAQPFFDSFATGQVEIPMPRSFDIQQRNAEIRALASQGKPRNALASQFAMTTRNIRRILSQCQ